MNKNLKLFLKCILTPLLLGVLSWLLSRSGIPAFQTLRKPPLTPPAYLFPIVWTILYIMMGSASYLIHRAKTDSPTRSEAFLLYGLQLGIQFLWPIFFFRFGLYFFSFIWLLFLWAVLWMNVQSFFMIRKSAGILLIPYLLWVSFAGYLNLIISLMN